jgi:transketolase
VGKAKDTSRPSLIVLKTVIGKGSPNKSGTSGVHGSPLGEDEILLTRENIGIGRDDAFHIDPEAKSFFAARREDLSAEYEQWKSTFAEWRKANPDLAKQWDASRDGKMEALGSAALPSFETVSAVATRKAGGAALTAIADAVPFLVGGSADLAASNNTALPKHGVFSVESPTGRTINFGVREHAMGAVSNGLALYGGLRPFCATFLVFSDYMRPSIRLAALIGLPVIYIFTHDSIFVGEDGPTHQPVEQAAALRVIPGLDVLRPGDGEETVHAWIMAMKRTEGPTALLLTRQNLTTYEKRKDWREDLEKGAHVVVDCDGTPDVVIVASGSEVNLALEAASASSRKVRVVSMISQFRFKQQPKSFRQAILPAGAKVVAVEVGVTQGWTGIASSPDLVFGLDRFGASGPGEEVAAHLGFTAANLTRMVEGA